jgi:hypothetical protein
MKRRKGFNALPPLVFMFQPRQLITANGLSGRLRWEKRVHRFKESLFLHFVLFSLSLPLSVSVSPSLSLSLPLSLSPSVSVSLCLCLSLCLSLSLSHSLSISVSFCLSDWQGELIELKIRVIFTQGRQAFDEENHELNLTL